MLKAVLLVCALNTPPGECRPDTALDVIAGPDTDNVIACALHGQAYFAQSALAQGLTDREYLKVICVSASAPLGSIPQRSDERPDPRRDPPIAERPLDEQAPAAGPVERPARPHHRSGS